MATLIPKVNSFPSHVTAGEKRVARRLEADLEEHCLCWYDIAVGATRRYPDFIILNPERGLLFLEVKDWKISNIKTLNHTTVEYICESGLKTLTNPIEQARQGAQAAIRLLEKDPKLQQTAGKHQGKLCFPYSYGVILSNITRRQLDNIMTPQEQQAILPVRHILCKDEIKESVSAQVLQNKLWDMFLYKFSHQLTREQIDRIRWHFYPEIRIDAKQLGLFTGERDDDSDSESDAIFPDIVKIMDPQQEILARSLGEGHRVIHGVAGSGKTLILIYRCIYLAEAIKKPILVVCYNLSLSAHLKSRIAHYGLSDRVEVINFDAWCSQQLRKHKLQASEAGKDQFEKCINSVAHYLENGQIPREQYGAVMIDEGHDLTSAALKILSQMTDEKTGSLLFMYDDAQSIYNKRENLGFSLASVGIQAQGRTTILKLNYRNSRQILAFSRDFLQRAFDALPDNKTEVLQPESAGVFGPEPQVYKARSAQEESKQVLQWIRTQRQQGLAWKDMAVLCPRKYNGEEFAAILQKENIPHCFYKESLEKRNYDAQKDLLSIFLIPSSKGLEFHSVAVINSSELNTARNEQAIDVAKKLYVGFTRATRQLFVSMHKENALSQLISGAEKS